ncbi:MAG: DUF523 domain-containing protein [Campylobacterota bacterium]|nr:DUF523 domain-containing protein [Campylobacterota bacterium]
MRKKKVAISACLLGEMCRYDGATKRVDSIIETFKDWEIIPFCPEAPVLGTPRERISVVSTDDGMKIIGDKSGRDVTELLIEQTQKLIDAHPDLDRIVLKSKSPSCGLGTTPISNTLGETIGFGDGVAASLLKDAFADIKISDEINFKGEQQC